MSHPADTTDYHAIHTCLRRGGRAIAEAMATLDVSDRRRVTALQRYWEGYAGEVLTHHTVEDNIFFPALVERAPVAVEHLGRIDTDHHLLDELMDEGHAAVAAVVDGAATDRAARVLAHLDAEMHQHLAFEDAKLLPLFARCFDQDEYDLLHKQAMKSLGFGKAVFFAVPFIGSWLDDQTRATLLGGAPLPFRVLYRVTRRGHERLAALALGAARHQAGAPLDLVPDQTHRRPRTSLGRRLGSQAVSDEREIMGWPDFGVASREIAQMVADDGYEPDMILSIARGGLLIGGALGYALSVKNVYTMNVEFYVGVDERLEVPRILPPAPDFVDLHDAQILIADDVADTGHTLRSVERFCEGKVREVRTAVLYEKPHSVVRCDYVWRRTDLWINFPWSDKDPVAKRAWAVRDA